MYDQCSGCTGTITNGIGRLVHESNYVNAASTYAYDPMGRIVQRSGCIPLNCNDAANVMTTTYDYLGDITSVMDSVGVKLSYQYNGAAELSTVTSSLNDSNHPSPLFSGPYYNETGLTSVTLGNKLYETRGYDSRLRLVSIADGSVYSVSRFPAPNGDVTSENDSVNGNWTYAYDDFNRLLSATNSAKSLAYTYGYDRYGNRWQQYLAGACTAGTTFCLTFDNNNRVNNGSLVYDTAGNVIQDSMHHYYYDAENRLIQVDGTLGTCSTTCYVYFPDGKRAEKKVAGVAVDYLYDPAGRENTELNSSLGWNRIEVYASERHLATYFGGATGTTYFNHADWLGTERARTTVTGGLCETMSSLAFGDGMGTSGSCGDPSPMHFTGKERDSESNLDNFGARYFVSSMGLFMSPDKLAGHTQDPQTLNRYLYVRDNPLSLTDPTGLDFYLSCQQASATCQKDAGGNLVQGTTTTDANGNSTFNATVVTSASLQDPNSGNTATVNENGIQITTASGTAQGIFINGTPAADIQGSGDLSDFEFHIDSSNEKIGTLDEGTFTYEGSRNQADVVKVLTEKGAFSYQAEQVFGNKFHEGKLNFRFSSGAHPNLFDYGPSPHLLVPVDPRATVPVGPGYTGGFHIDSHTGPQHLLCAEKQIGCNQWRARTGLRLY